jgi:alkylation response protein AidB-like acyl-CoA dehydrogenase
MFLRLTEDQELLRETFAQFFAAESSCDRVRAAEPLGFDPGLWAKLAETGALGIRASEARGGGGAGLLEACLVAGEAGRHLVSGPFLEGVLAGRLLSACEGGHAETWGRLLLGGDKVVTLALHDLSSQPGQWLQGGPVADALVARDGDDLVLLVASDAARSAPSRGLGSCPLTDWSTGSAERIVLASGDAARALHGAAVEEWKLLMASALVGLSREALEIAGRYASERVQFGRPIGAFQGIAHPLADSALDTEGARLLIWKAVWAIAERRPEAAALVSLSFAWSAHAAGQAVARALHTHGGYGLSLEYDSQLYHSRAKTWPLVWGDPQRELIVAADRLWRGAGDAVSLPDVGESALDFGYGADAEAFAERARFFFAENLTDPLREHAHFAWEGHHPGFQRKLAEAGLLFPAWPREYGGQERGPYDMAALAEVFDEFDWSRMAITTTDMAARSVLAFGSDELKREAITRIVAGDAICSLGYTEPGCGSDVASVQTRAVRDGDEWVIDGQKMFTSGANLAQYVLLLTRSNPDVPKHKGLTMFLVPLDTPGIEIQAVETLSDERTNITFYNAVRVSDSHRLGEVDAGWAVASHGLELEHGGTQFVLHMRRMLAGAVAWARTPRAGGLPIDRPEVRMRLARAALHTEIADAIWKRALHVGAERIDDAAIGPMSKLFSSDRFIESATDLMDLCAPDSLVRGREGGAATCASAVEFAYRLSTATSIYGGTSEILKSILAEISLGLPRSRS